MGKQRQTALILGEGPTEFFYFKSLCDVFKRLTIKPDYPKHTNICLIAETKTFNTIIIVYWQ